MPIGCLSLSYQNDARFDNITDTLLSLTKNEAENMCNIAT